MSGTDCDPFVPPNAQVSRAKVLMHCALALAVRCLVVS